MPKSLKVGKAWLIFAADLFLFLDSFFFPVWAKTSFSERRDLFFFFSEIKAPFSVFDRRASSPGNGTSSRRCFEGVPRPPRGWVRQPLRSRPPTVACCPTTWWRHRNAAVDCWRHRTDPTMSRRRLTEATMFWLHWKDPTTWWRHWNAGVSTRIIRVTTSCITATTTTPTTSTSMATTTMMTTLSTMSTCTTGTFSITSACNLM